MLGVAESLLSTIGTWSLNFAQSAQSPRVFSYVFKSIVKFDLMQKHLIIEIHFNLPIMGKSQLVNLCQQHIS